MTKNEDEMKRFPRVLAIYFQLDSHRFVTKAALAEKFEVSEKTIYRDIKALRAANLSIDFAKGRYSLIAANSIGKIQLTREEANALITAEQLILKNKDTSFIEFFTAAVRKVKEALDEESKEKAALLSERTNFVKSYALQGKSHYLVKLQSAFMDLKVVEIRYRPYGKEEPTTRRVEIFAITCSLEEDWLLHAMCRLRGDFRVFRLDRIQSMEVLAEKFEQQKMTLGEYYVMQEKKSMI